ncbi:MAG TPA: POTRA domain-containing protein, partial [Terriglobales bacterium]|nr:POTRA domain-containing protein [Terriglobales bacterium]
MRWSLLLFLAAFSLSGAAQTTASNVPPFYEGQKVASITIAANPHLDVEHYRSLISQQPDEPFSQQKVNASVEALKKTNAFSDVRVTVLPDTGGLKLTFVLEPAYYIGMIKFPGAMKYFSYSRLLQVVNLPDRTVFQKADLDTANEALVKFFQGYGFFLATAHADTQFDDANQLAHVTFRVVPGPHAHIGKVEVRGSTPEENRKLEEVMRSFKARFTGALLKRGKPYSPRRIQAATALLKSALSKQHYPDNKILVADPQYDPKTNLATVTFNVDTGPVIDIRLVGAKLTWIPFQSGRLKKKLISIYDEGSVDPDIIEESRRNLTDYFQRKGYFDVKVNTNSQQRNGRTILTFQIDKGQKYSVNEIAFSGNHNLSDSDLAAQVQVKKRRLLSHGLYSAKLLQASAKNIENLYKDNGFEDVKVTPQAVQRNNAIFISFNIAEGDRTTVSSLRVEGNKSIPLNQLLFRKQKFLLEEGKPFSPKRMSNDRNHIAAKYLDRGFLNSEVKTVVSRHPDDPHEVDVTYQIIENQQVRISHVVYMGYRRTRLSLIERSANLAPEQPLSQSKLLQGESNLYDYGIFDWASIGPKKDITTQTDEEALVKVHEAKRNSITYGFGFEISRRGGNVPSGSVAVPGLPTVGLHGLTKVQASDKIFASPRGSIEYTRLNVRGLGETFAISLLAARLDQKAIATYTDPHFRGTSWQALTSISAERTTENPLFQARLGDASIQFQRYLNRRKTQQLQLRYDFNRTNLSQLIVPELVLPADRNVRLSYVSSTIIEDTRDKPLDAHRGVYSTVDFRIVPSAFGSSADFTRLFSQYAFYKPVHGMVFANSIRLGLAAPFAGSDVPTSERFFAGGGTTLRGFPIDQAGPVRNIPFCQGKETDCPVIPIPVGGNQLFILNSELRYPIPIMNNLGGVVFYDGGNVYRR